MYLANSVSVVVIEPTFMLHSFSMFIHHTVPLCIGSHHTVPLCIGRHHTVYVCVEHIHVVGDLK